MIGLKMISGPARGEEMFEDFLTLHRAQLWESAT
jgi:hypothetical protein